MQPNELMIKGTLALADVERNGIRIDVHYCTNQQKIVNKKILEIENEMSKSKEMKLWKKTYKDKFNMDSNPQLSDILFNYLKVKSGRVTAKGNLSVDKLSLDAMKIPFVQSIIEIRKLKKLNNTYLKNIIEETVDGILRPSFNLHTVKTFRSSSDKINFQNLPIRDPEMGKIIRRAFIPRPGSWIGGIDYEGIEVKISAVYHKDRAMLKYIKHSESDMHKDMAMECYMLEGREVSKESRYCAKNQFVFPQFYGSWYEPCAQSLWDSIDKMKLETKRYDSRMDCGVPLKINLQKLGIKTYKQFERHIMKVEDKFWNEKFTGYRDWKIDWFKQYEKKGHFDMLTGFRCKGVMKRNDVINYPVQGVAFHCLLWSLIKLNRWLKKNKMRSMIIGQIHDDITMNIYETEFEDVLKKAKQIMCEDIRKEWKWLIVPLTVEASFSPINWHDVKEVTI